MVAVRKSSLSKYAGSRKRRRSTSVRTRVRLEAPTAKNQKRQIAGNAANIAKIVRQLPPPVYCDFQYKLKIPGVISPDGDPSFSQKAFSLVDFNNTWAPVLRIATSTNSDVATKILRMQFQMQYNLLGSDWAQMTIFVVTLRKDAANRDPTATPLQSGADFVVNDDLQLPRLNPAIYKVHYTRNITMSSSTYQLGAATVQGNTFAGNPMTTTKRGRFTIKPNMKIRAPAQNFWRQMVPNQLPYYQRYFLLTFITQNNPPNLAQGGQCVMEMDMVATTYNTA